MTNGLFHSANRKGTAKRVGIANRELAVLSLVCLFGCSGSTPPAALFREVTAEVGLPAERPEFPDGTYLVPEVTHGGVSLLDYDGDGDLDIYQVCHPAPSSDLFQAKCPNRLYEQQPDGTFVEVAARAQVDDPGLGNAAAVGDVDSDGDLDIYVANYGADTLYINEGNGTFVNQSAAAGIGGTLWSSAAAFVDYDRDDDLDLIVSHYLDYSADVSCKNEEGQIMYCGPRRFKGTPDTLYENDGNGKFTDVSENSGIRSKRGKGLGIVCVDLTGDDLVDIVVTNDGEANFLWVNRGDGTFTEEAAARGVAFNGHGSTEASMGVTVGDIDRDGGYDLFMTHFREQTNTLYRSRQGHTYEDHSAVAGTAAFDMPYTGWGCAFCDFDHDGNLDLAIINGAADRRPVEPGASLGPFWNEYAEPNLYFRGTPTGQFENVSHLAGTLCSRIEGSRGLALGDLDRDGDMDCVTSNIDNMLRVFYNDAPAAGSHWLQIRARVAGRDALGADILLELASRGGVWRRPLIATYSYAGSNEPVTHFGLGGVTHIPAAVVTWPDGSRERFTVGDVDRVLTFEAGTGEAMGP